MENAKIKLTGLWKNETRDGQSFLAGSISPGVRLLIFDNGFRKKPTDPEFIAYLAQTQRAKPGNEEQETSQGDLDSEKKQESEVKSSDGGGGDTSAG